jgi:sortase A
VTHRALRWTIGGLGDILVTAGAVLLLFVAWQLWWTDVEANRAQGGTVQALARDFSSAAPTAPAAAPNEKPTPVRFGEAFAIVRIPRLGDDFARPLLEGTDYETLKKGLGHYRGTAAPGAVGNLAMAGHRTTYGRPLHDIDRLRKGDKVVVETKSGYSVYAVDGHEVVAPTEVEVIAPVPNKPGAEPNGAWLTLTACHPKYSAAQRYVVFAKLVQTYPRATGLPAGTLDAPTTKS